MDFSRQGLERDGFTDFVRIADLKKPGGCDVIPEQMGVYVVVRESTLPRRFLDRSIGGFFHGEDPTLSREELERKWVDGAYVLYIGKAGGLALAATLRSRVRQYMDFGNGRPVGHRGGKMIWQLADCDELLIAWKPLVGTEPVAVEQQMIDEFVDNRNTPERKLPFANRRR